MNSSTQKSEAAEPARVLHLLSTSAVGGTERMVLRLTQHGSHENIRHELACLLPGGDVPRRAREAGVPVHDLGGGGFFRLGRRLRALLQEERFAVVHLYGLRADVLGRRSAARAGARVVSAIRSTDPWRRRRHNLLDRITQRSVDLWISNSEAGRQAALKRQPLAPESVVTIHSGVEEPAPLPEGQRADLRRDWGSRAGLGPNAEPAVFLCLANLRPMKGHETLLRAFARTSEAPSPKLLLLVGRDGPAISAGHSSRADELLALARDLGIEKRVLFEGPAEDPSGLLRAADAQVLASDHEGFPASLLEGMAAGLPTVATRVGGIPEMIGDGIEGRLVAPAEVEPLAAAMAEMAADEARRTELGQAAHRRWAAEFTLERMIERLNETYLALAQNRQRRAEESPH